MSCSLWLASALATGDGDISDQSGFIGVPLDLAAVSHGVVGASGFGVSPVWLRGELGLGLGDRPRSLVIPFPSLEIRLGLAGS